MGIPVHSTGRVKHAKECWSESRTINGSTAAAKTKEKSAERHQPALRTSTRPFDENAGSKFLSGTS